MTKIIIGIAIGAAILMAVFLAGVSAQKAISDRHVAEMKAQFEQHIAAANKATEADKETLAGLLKQSEEQIDRLNKEYQDALKTDVACTLTDDDVRSLWNGGGAARPKPGNQRRLRRAARSAPTP